MSITVSGSSIVGDNGSPSAAVTAGSPIAYTFSAGSGTNRGLFVWLAILDADGGDPIITAATYNGAAMTFIGSRRGSGTGNGPWVACWYVQNHASGSNVISVTLDDTANAHQFYVLELNGVKQTGSPIGSTSPVTSGPGGSTLHSITFTSDAASSLNVYCAATRGNDAAPFTLTNGDAIVFQSTSGASTLADFAACLIREAATGGSDTLAMTAAVSDRQAGVGFEVLAEPGGGGVSFPQKMFKTNNLGASGIR